MRWQGWKTASMRWPSQRQTKQGCSHWAGAERKMTECGRAEAKGTVTHTSAAGLLRHELDSLTWALPSKAAQHSSESRERLQGQRAHLHGWWLDGCIMLLMGRLALFWHSRAHWKYMWYLLFLVTFLVATVEEKHNRRPFKKLHVQGTRMICFWIYDIDESIKASLQCAIETLIIIPAKCIHLICFKVKTLVLVFLFFLILISLISFN